MAPRVVVVNPSGFEYGDLDNAVVHVTWELNGPGGADISLPPQDPSAALLIGGREIQVWRDEADPVPIFWGPLVRCSASMEMLSWQCAGLLWYFSRRYFGEADRTNLLSDGDFELGAAGWTLGTVGAVSVTRWISGTSSLRVEETTAEADSYVSQEYVHHQSHPLGDLLTVAAWVYVPTADYVGPAFDGRGLYMERRNSLGDVVDSAFEPIDDETPKDEWVRLETQLELAQEGDTIEVRLYSPQGVAFWDLVVLVSMESLSFIDTDVATIAEGIALYAQGRYGGFDHGKSDLRIDTDTTALGISRSRTYQFAEHRQILDALVEFTEAGDFDMDVVLTATSRTFTTYEDKGVDRLTVLSLATNLSRFSWSWDGEVAANSLVVLGPGDGPDREEGAAVLSGFLGGLTLEAVSTAPDSATVSELDERAAQEILLYRRPEVLEVTTRPGAGLVGVLEVGDRLPVSITWGGTTVDGDWRIVRMTLDLLADTLDLTLNPEISLEDAMARLPGAVDACRAPGGGVWVVATGGAVGAYGGASDEGDMDGQPLNAPMVAIVPYSSTGYWLIGADTGIFAFGNAPTRLGYSAMIDTEYPAGDRAIVAAEAYVDGSDQTVIMLADDGSTYIGDVP